MNSIRVTNPKKSVFDLTHDVKLSCNMGKLVPVMVTDLVPGDVFKVGTEALIRFAPMIAPMYHRCNVTFHTWAVPYRILWPNWSDYITETKTAGVLPAFPTLKMLADAPSGWYSELMDYLGIPPNENGGAGNDETVSAMRFAAYQCIYNEFYRDENLVQEVNYMLDDGDNSSNLNELKAIRNRAWVHDYFTSNLPFAQKGDPVDLPVALSNANVKRNADPALGTPPGEVASKLDTTNVSFPVSGSTTWVDNTPSLDPTIGTEGLYADMANATGTTTINDLRLAEALQKYLERAARSGTRLVEWIKGMFGETLPDYTAQRPQYVGGTKSPVQISEVLNTSGDTLPQGNMSGRGLAASAGKQGTYHAREHCVMMTIMSIMPETSYQQGLERQWLKYKDPKDFLNPLFAHLGEQETINKELLAYHVDGDGTFGYLPRFSEYRTIPSRVAGDFRTTLNYWHMGRIFDPSVMPQLNVDFINCDPTHRVFADTDPTDNKMYVHVLNRIRAVRPLPKYGTPSL